MGNKNRCNWLTNEWKSWSFMMSHWFWQNWWVCKRFVLVGLEFKNRWHCAHCKRSSALFPFQMIFTGPCSIPGPSRNQAVTELDASSVPPNAWRVPRVLRHEKKYGSAADRYPFVHSPWRLGKPKIPIGSAFQQLVRHPSTRTLATPARKAGSTPRFRLDEHWAGRREKPVKWPKGTSAS